MPHSEQDIIEEQIHFSNVVATFEQYGSYSLAANNRRRRDLYRLPPADQKLLEELGWKEKLSKIDQAILKNKEFVLKMVDDPRIFANADLAEEEDSEIAAGGQEQNEESNADIQDNFHSHSHSGPSQHNHSHDSPGAHTHSHDHPHPHISPRKRYRPSDFDMDKLRSTLKQLVRDWSVEGEEERDATYGPLKEALLEHFKDVPVEKRSKIRVLIPGTGLGRLAYEVARLGFACQGNEFSHYMLLASYFILNRSERINQHTIYPYVHSLSNLPTGAALLRPVTIPDVLPSDLPEGSDFSLVAGDFEEIYGADENEENEHEPQAGKWDAVLTCFFIDTAKNVVNYLRIIRKILAPGGVWINIGPLLWHWENNTTNDPSIELDLEEVKTLCKNLGFQLTHERTIDTSYTSNAQTMLSYIYHTAFWVATPINETET